MQQDSSSINKDTLLFNAIKKNSRKKIESSLKKGANVNNKYIYGRTPLHYIAQKGDVENMQLLFDNSPKIRVRDTREKMPLHDAAENKNIKLYRMVNQ